MNILHVENSSGRGGSLKSLRSLWPPPENWKVKVLSLKRAWSNDIQIDYPVFYLPNQSVYKSWRLLQRQKINVVHINNAPIESWSVVLAAFWEGIPVVSHMRSVRNLRKFEKFLVKRIKTLWVLSYFHKNLLKKNKVNSEVLYNGIKDPGRAPHSNEPNVGIFSALKQNKGHEDIFHALAAIKMPWRLLVVGGDVTDQPSTLPSLKKLAIKLSISDKVEFRGYQSDPLSDMSECFLVVDASWKAEGFRRTLGEAALFGKKVLATNVGGASDLLDSEFLIPPKNREIWESVLRRELELKDQNEDHQQSGLRAKALKMFDANKTRMSFWQKIERVVGYQ